jgi:CheY-like chemotaxis protein
MPEMDGFAFLDELRATDDGQEIPVVVVSADLLSQEQLARLDGKVDAILRKGKRESLLAALRDQVRTSVARRTEA